MQLPQTAAVPRPEPDSKQDDDDQQDENQQTVFPGEEPEKGNQGQNGKGNDTELNIHGDNEPERNQKCNRNR